MKAMFRKRPLSKAFTLIEVVAGLILLASLGSGILLAVSRHHRQSRLAQNRLEAIQVTETMMAAWHSSSEGIPVVATGPVPEHANWIWRIGPIDNRILAGQPVQILRFEILQQDNVLSSVELVRRTTEPRQ